MSPRPTHPGDPSAPSEGGGGDRDVLSRRELDHLAERFGLGSLRSVRPIGRGTARGRAVRAQTDAGVVVLKRRDHTDPARAAFTHRARLFLASRGVPFPPLLGTHDENNSLVVFEGLVYEAAVWIEGRECRATAEDAAASCTALARLHRAAVETPLEVTADPRATVAGPFHADPEALRDAVERRDQPEAASLLALLLSADAIDGTDAPPTLLHGDWHPGNLLFEDPADTPRVRAVLDPDQIRLGDTASDLGAALLHHSFVRDDSSCDKWPTRPDLDRLRAGWDAYRAAVAEPEGGGPPPPEAPSPDATARAMVKALASEALGRVLSGADLGRHEPAAFLVMAARKAEWLARHGTDALTSSSSPDAAE